jgi:hypothetical protein
VGAAGSNVGVVVGGTGVGNFKACFVGGKVEVTKTTGASVGACAEVLTHAASSKITIKANAIRCLFMYFMDFQNLP